MGYFPRPIDARYMSLALSNFTAQAVENPRVFTRKVAMRVNSRNFSHSEAFSNGNSRPDFRIPIFQSCSGGGSGTVLHVLTNSLPHSAGGYAIRSHGIMRAQLEAGVNVSAITRLGYPVSIGKLPMNEVEFVEGVRYARSLPYWFPFRLKAQVDKHALRIEQEAQLRGASILHTTTPWTNAAATSLAARRLQIPWVYEVRGEPEATWATYQPKSAFPESTEYFRSARLKEEQAMRAAGAVVVLSATSASSLRDRGINSTFGVVSNAVDAGWGAQKMSRESAFKRLGLQPRKYVGAISSLVKYEGFDNLIRSLHYLPPDIAVLLVGDGSYGSHLRALARDEGLESRVVFTGRLPSDCMAACYSALSVFVVPRKDTPVTRTVTPLKTLQAQAFGIPIVSTDLPALVEVTQGAATFVPSEDPEKLARAILLAFTKSRQTPPRRLPTWADGADALLKLYSDL